MPDDDPELQAALSNVIASHGRVIEDLLEGLSPVVRAGVLGPVATRVFQSIPEQYRMGLFDGWVALARKNITPGGG